VCGITPERGWKRAPQQYLGPMGSRAHDHGAEGAASRPHAHTRYHNRVSEEIKPGYSGHVPVARETCGTSHYRDSFTHPKLAWQEDGSLSYRSTSSKRFFTGNLDERHASLGGNASGWKSERGGYRRPIPTRPPGLNDRERIAGRSRAAPRLLGGRRVYAQDAVVSV
jgi:hypothetical protein